LEVPVAEGVPDTCPVEALRVSPAGNDAETTLHEYGAVPPLAASPAEYVFCEIPPARADVLMLSVLGEVLTVAENCSDAAWGGLLESTTRTVNADVPAAVGVPETTPVEEFRLRPAGRVPADTAHV
jgi:hypothetical protein